MTHFRTHYETVVIPALRKEFGYTNSLAVPRLVKVVLNVGIPAGNKDQKVAETVAASLARITGQKPVPTLAKKSIANFKIRKGMVVGYKVTLRGSRLETFVDKLVRITLPRVRDFRGIPESSVDVHGNLSIGFKEVTAFPETRPEDIERTHGLEVALASTARTRAEGIALYRALGIPFRAK